MNRPVSELTYKIVAFPDIQQFNADESVDWAIEMIELGHVSKSLFVLASIKKPVNYFEIVTYIKSAVEELRLKLRSGDRATLSYAAYYAHQIADAKDVRENLTKLYKFCQARDYETLVYNFYLLYWAWDDLDYEDEGNNHYWEGANRNNIEPIVVDEAAKWIEKYRKHYEQTT